MHKRFFWMSLFVGATLSGCTVGPDYRAPEIASPPTWNGVEPAQPAATQPAGPITRPAQVATWWKSLDDPQLDSLINRAIESNLDLRIATARIREARATRGSVAADLWPQVDASGSYNFRGSSLNTGPEAEKSQGLGAQIGSAALSSVANAVGAGQTINAANVSKDVVQQVGSSIINNKLNKSDSSSRNQNLFQAGFDASWEIDVFGGIRRSVEAADADVAAMEENRRDVLVTLVSEVALNYIQLRGYQRRLAIANENIEAQQGTLELTQKRYESGFTSQLDVAQAQTQLANTRSQVPLLATAIRQSIYQLSVLLGQMPASLQQELSTETPLPKVPIDIPIGLPSDLLRRRPDIRIAERQLAAATARIGVATADLFPRFSLTGSFGSQSRNVNYLLDRNSLMFSIGPAVSWPVFDGWRIRSNIEVSNAQQEQTLTQYEKTVLTAFQEVENALVAYTNERIRHQTLIEAVEASEQSKNLSNELYTRGMAAFLNVLEAQRTLYASQDALVESETTVITDLIALYKSLGGGWDMKETRKQEVASK